MKKGVTGEDMCAREEETQTGIGGESESKREREREGLQKNTGSRVQTCQRVNAQREQKDRTEHTTFFSFYYRVME